MGETIRFMQELVAWSISGEWTILGTTAPGYWLVPTCGALVGWYRSKDRLAISAIRDILINALAAVVLVFVCIFVYELTWSVPRQIWGEAAVLIPPKVPPPPSAPNIEFPIKVSFENDLGRLKQRTVQLAQEIIDFTYTRDGQLNDLQQQAIAQAFLSALNQSENGPQEFHERLTEWNQETANLFNGQIWSPQVVPLLSDLGKSGIDVSPVARALASGSLRKIGMMLSVVAARIGHRPPYSRTLTPIEVSAIIRGFNGINMEIYADREDRNSVQIAETVQAEFKRNKSAMSDVIHDLPKQTPIPRGIHIIFPSADWTVNFSGMIAGFGECDIETAVDIRFMKQPPSIFKIEVWPATPNWQPAVGPSLVRPR